ncbi:hypothetical protein AMS66_18500 [Paenibacillus xylanivorans]|uniref:Uncharacterized protein n=1 Tax=Paenibacillus xylanivorans TaxID=1705561 RepID=A0A0M9BM27_9BACL|nr:hypothetical protein AMS66_18500 [Paenibacillus xylanivorans]
MIVYDLVSMETNHFLIQTVNSRIEDGIWNVIGNGPIPRLVYVQFNLDGLFLKVNVHENLSRNKNLDSFPTDSRAT